MSDPANKQLEYSSINTQTIFIFHLMQKLLGWSEGKIWQLQWTNYAKVGHKEVTSKQNKD